MIHFHLRQCKRLAIGRVDLDSGLTFAGAGPGALDGAKDGILVFSRAQVGVEGV